MKKIYLFILLLVASVQFGHTQIKTDINGLESGKTGIYDCVTLLKDVDSDCFYYESNGKIYVSAQNFPYAGVNWTTILASIENNHLVRIQLNAEDRSLSEQEFDKLQKAFDDKYKDYLVYSSSEAYMFKDEHVRVLLSLDKGENSYCLIYTYEYKPKIGDGI